MPNLIRQPTLPCYCKTFTITTKRVVKLCLLFIDGVSLCEQRGTGTERAKNLREQSGERESKKWTDRTTIKQSYLICWNATVLAFCLWPTTFTGAPFRRVPAPLQPCFFAQWKFRTLACPEWSRSGHGTQHPNSGLSRKIRDCPEKFGTVHNPRRYCYCSFS